MGRVYEKFVGTYLGGSINVSKAVPLDVKTVVRSITDLTSDELLVSVYEGLVVYVVDEKSLYVCHSKPEDDYLENVEDGWKKVDIDYSVRIVETESNLTDGETIKFPYQGMMAYVNSESALYILLTKGLSKAKLISNWKKISSFTPTADKVAIDVVPEGGSGFMISGNTGVVVDDYINAENYIKAKYNYTSKGVNSFEPNPLFDYDVILTKDGVDGYIELYMHGENWIKINNPNNFGLSVTVDGEDYISDTPIAKETHICFGADVKFHEGWKITYGDTTKDFTSDNYDLIDIYRSEYSPMVRAYRKDIDIRMLTEDDLVGIDDKINNLAHSIMVDVGSLGESDSSDSDIEEPITLQEAITNINNSINKLEQTKPEPETIEYSEIDKLFS